MGAASVLPMGALSVALAASAALLAPGAAHSAPGADGAALYKRCAACHLPTGAGVPSAFPPLQTDFRTLAAKPEGRRYLALAVLKGLSGPITVEGKAYSGIMPAQGGMDDAAVAAVLTHVGTAVAKSGPALRPFTAAEVAEAKEWGKALTPARVAQLHAGAGGR